MRYLTVEEILRLHFQVIEDFGGAHGVRSEDRLLSLVRVPQQEVFGAEQYVSVFEKAAVYLRNIIGDHPYVDGNKRTAITVAGVFLMRSKRHLSASPLELENFAVQIATEHLDISTIAAWLQKHCQ